MTRPTVIGGCLGGALGVLIYVLLWRTGARIFLILAMPGWIPVLWLRGFAQTPSVETVTLQIMAYSVVGALIGWLFGCRSRRPKPGMCPDCGYDLRGSKNQCPECGLAIGEKRGLRWVLRKRSIWVCLVISVSAFPIFLIGATSAILLITDHDLSIGIASNIIISFNVILAYLATRLVYTLLRWRRNNELDDEHD